MLLSKWHSSGEKLLLNHMQFKWNRNNNPCLKRSIALSYQTLQCVGCITVLAIRETHCAQGPALNYVSLIHNMKKKKRKIPHTFASKKIINNRKYHSQTQKHRNMHHCDTKYSTKKVPWKGQRCKLIVTAVIILHPILQAQILPSAKCDSWTVDQMVCTPPVYKGIICFGPPVENL